MIPNTHPYYTTLPSHRARLAELYLSTYGCPPAADTDLREQAKYLRFVLPTPDHLDQVATVLAEGQEELSV